MTPEARATVAAPPAGPAVAALAAALAALAEAQRRGEAPALDQAAAHLQRVLQAGAPGLRARAAAGRLEPAERQALAALGPALAALRDDLGRAQAAAARGLDLLLPADQPVYGRHGASRPAGRGLLA